MQEERRRRQLEAAEKRKKEVATYLGTKLLAFILLKQFPKIFFNILNKLSN